MFNDRRGRLIYRHPQIFRRRGGAACPHRIIHTHMLHDGDIPGYGYRVVRSCAPAIDCSSGGDGPKIVLHARIGRIGGLDSGADRICSCQDRVRKRVHENLFLTGYFRVASVETGIGHQEGVRAQGIPNNIDQVGGGTRSHSSARHGPQVTRHPGFGKILRSRGVQTGGSRSGNGGNRQRFYCNGIECRRRCCTERGGVGIGDADRL